MSRAYYNDKDPFAAQLLRNLVEAGLIPAGDVDERSILDVRPSDLEGYTQCHFFAGIGGWPYAARLAGWPDDQGLWTGSCPCQPFSSAGKKAGAADDRHLWPAFFDLIQSCLPDVVMGEQVAAAVGNGWLDGICDDLEGVDYTCRAAIVPALSVNAKHIRHRIWFVANAEWHKQPRQEPRGRQAGRVGRIVEPFPWNEPWESALSRFRALADGLPRNVGATDAARNAIVPQVAAEVIAAYLDETAPKCPYCGVTDRLRVACDGGGVEAPEFTCEGCFTGTDTGPSFDDLPEASIIRLCVFPHCNCEIHCDS